ncbi:thioredoxin [Blattabacterium cuenoti]|uniref:thioredoxin n=1 Tax=Blattabacterium cuenoti TaxID=1653831 RepID=UPI00163BBC80|nr:thioredoxin [Blattabacterium cuenoti]
MLQEINDNNFHELIIESHSNKPILVDFWAPWCTPCRTLSEVLEEILDEYKEKVLFFKLNVDKNPTVSSQYGIRSIPTIIFFKNGQKQNIHIGIASKKDIRNKINILLTEKK